MKSITMYNKYTHVKYLNKGNWIFKWNSKWYSLFYFILEPKMQNNDAKTRRRENDLYCELKYWKKWPQWSKDQDCISSSNHYYYSSVECCIVEVKNTDNRTFAFQKKIEPSKHCQRWSEMDATCQTKIQWYTITLCPDKVVFEILCWKS